MNFEKLNETNCRVNHIQNGDKVLIGGSYPGILDLKITVDTNHFEPFFQTVKKNADSLENNENMKAWLQYIAPRFDTQIFLHLYAFDNVLRKMYPRLSANKQQRHLFYDKEGTKTLSEAFEKGICQCAEIAVLSQIYLQRQDVNSTYFGGELLHSPQAQFGEAHSFISLKTPDGQDFFYDPANPTLHAGTYLPKISSIEATPTQLKQFENKIHTQNEKRNCAFLEAKDIITGSAWYYGCGDGGDIFPSFIISQNNRFFPPINGKSL